MLIWSLAASLWRTSSEDEGGPTGSFRYRETNGEETVQAMHTHKRLNMVISSTHYLRKHCTLDNFPSPIGLHFAFGWG